MTGRNPNRFGCFAWGRPLRPQEVTIAERLKDAGYVTGHFGKWHLGSVLKGSPVNPGNSGFDHWLSAFNFYDNDPVLSREGKVVEVIELYNLKDDPMETKDLAAEQSERVTAMREELETWMGSVLDSLNGEDYK